MIVINLGDPARTSTSRAVTVWMILAVFLGLLTPGISLAIRMLTASEISTSGLLGHGELFASAFALSTTSVSRLLLSDGRFYRTRQLLLGAALAVVGLFTVIFLTIIASSDLFVRTLDVGSVVSTSLVFWSVTVIIGLAVEVLVTWER